MLQEIHICIGFGKSSEEHVSSVLFGHVVHNPCGSHGVCFNIHVVVKTYSISIVWIYRIVFWVV